MVAAIARFPGGSRVDYRIGWTQNYLERTDIPHSRRKTRADRVIKKMSRDQRSRRLGMTGQDPHRALCDSQAYRVASNLPCRFLLRSRGLRRNSRSAKS